MPRPETLTSPAPKAVAGVRTAALPRRLIVADPGLRDARGHHLGYSVALADAARQRNIEPLLLVAREFCGAVPAGIACQPSFSVSYQSAGGGGALRRVVFGIAARLPPLLGDEAVAALRRLRRLLRPAVADGFAGELAAMLAADGSDTSADMLLLHSVSAANLAGLTAALPAACIGTVAIILRRTPAEMDRDDGGGLPVTTILSALQRHFAGRLRLFADTEPLCLLWSTAIEGIADVALAPLPVVAPPTREPTPTCRPHLLFLGGARAEKGYALLPRLAGALGHQVCLTIHSGPVDAAADPAVQRAHRELRARSGPWLTLIERIIPADEYQALLRTADLLLLPYDAAAYGPRSSGILAEARAAGLPAIVPAGCWMAENAGPDAAALTFADPARFVETARGALSRLPALRQEHSAAAPAWRETHSPEKLLAALLTDSV